MVGTSRGVVEDGSGEGGGGAGPFVKISLQLGSLQ